MTRSRELWFVAPHAVEVREGAASPQLQPGQLRAQALASGISQGTELLLFRGEGPTPFDPSLDAPGAPTYPRRYGYAWVGEVVESQSAFYAVGSRLFALLPHGDEHCLDTDRARTLPADVPAERAVLAANLETAITVVWDAGVGLGDDVVVIGGGVVGLLCGFAARLGGARRVRLIEPSLRRREAALALGFEQALAPEEDVPQGDADIVVEASGNPSCLDVAIAHARQDGRLIVASFYGNRTAPVQLGSTFHRRRLTLMASQVSRLPAGRAARWSFERRFALVSQLLRNAALDLLLDPSVSLDDASRVYARLAAHPGATLQTVFRYRP